MGVSSSEAKWRARSRNHEKQRIPPTSAKSSLWLFLECSQGRLITFASFCERRSAHRKDLAARFFTRFTSNLCAAPHIIEVIRGGLNRNFFSLSNCELGVNYRKIKNQDQMVIVIFCACMSNLHLCRKKWGILFRLLG